MPGPAFALPPRQPLQFCAEECAGGLERFSGVRRSPAGISSSAWIVRGRSLIDNIWDVAFVMEAALITGARSAGSVLFDTAAAVPSVEWNWLLQVLTQQRLPHSAIRLVRGLLENSLATVPLATLLHLASTRGEAHGRGVPAVARYGPLLIHSSGAFPMVWLAPFGMCLTDCVGYFRCSAPCCRRRGSRQTWRNRFWSTSSGSSDGGLQTLLRPLLGAAGTDHAECVGILIGLGSPARFSGAPIAKYRSRCHYARSLALHVHARHLAYQVFAFSVLLFRGLLPPGGDFLTAEAAACAARARFHAFMVACPSSFRAFGARYAFPSISHENVAAATRVALTHPFLGPAPSCLRPWRTPTTPCSTRTALGGGHQARYRAGPCQRPPSRGAGSPAPAEPRPLHLDRHRFRRARPPISRAAPTLLPPTSQMGRTGGERSVHPSKADGYDTSDSESPPDVPNSPALGSPRDPNSDPDSGNRTEQLRDASGGGRASACAAPGDLPAPPRLHGAIGPSCYRKRVGDQPADVASGHSVPRGRR